MEFLEVIEATVNVGFDEIELNMSKNFFLSLTSSDEGYDGLKAMEVAIKAYESANLKTPIRIMNWKYKQFSILG